MKKLVIFALIVVVGVELCSAGDTVYVGITSWIDFDKTVAFKYGTTGNADIFLLPHIVPELHYGYDSGSIDSTREFISYNSHYFAYIDSVITNNDEIEEILSDLIYADISPLLGETLYYNGLSGYTGAFMVVDSIIPDYNEMHGIWNSIAIGKLMNSAKLTSNRGKVELIHYVATSRRPAKAILKLVNPFNETNLDSLYDDLCIDCPARNNQVGEIWFINIDSDAKKEVLYFPPGNYYRFFCIFDYNRDGISIVKAKPQPPWNWVESRDYWFSFLPTAIYDIENDGINEIFISEKCSDFIAVCVYKLESSQYHIMDCFTIWLAP